jgi:hypothetical protein
MIDWWRTHHHQHRQTILLLSTTHCFFEHWYVGRLTVRRGDALFCSWQHQHRFACRGLIAGESAYLGAFRNKQNLPWRLDHSFAVGVVSYRKQTPYYCNIIVTVATERSRSAYHAEMKHVTIGTFDLFDFVFAGSRSFYYLLPFEFE